MVAMRCMSGILLGAWLGAAGAQPVTYQLDPEHSWVQFEVDHFATSTLRGRIGPVRGEVVWDRRAGRAEIGLAIPTASVDTGLKFLDKRLCAADLLDCAAYPQAWFVATTFRHDPVRLGITAVRGEFTLHGVSQPLELSAERFGCRQPAAGGPEVCGGDFVAELRRSDFGITFGLPFVADRVVLRVQVEGIAPP
jgi:polyisoprenoid-binding protein YceI